jgi:glycosyltransferase involved in cell wall biosynthesis
MVRAAKAKGLTEDGAARVEFKPFDPATKRFLLVCATRSLNGVALYRLGLRIAHRRWYISKFVARTWEGEKLHPHSAVVPATSELPSIGKEPRLRQGFLFIARWVPKKGLEELVMAYDSAEIAHKKHPLTLVGDGPLKPKITEMIAQAKTIALHLDPEIGDLQQVGEAHLSGYGRTG